MDSDGRRENLRKGRPETLKPLNALFFGKDVPFISLTGIGGCFCLRRTIWHGLRIEMLLRGVMVSHGKEKVPEQGKLFLPR
jgi:hypothetical protein